MANKAAAKKTIRSDARKRGYNDRLRRDLKALMKGVRNDVQKGDIKAAEEKLPKAYKAIDKASKRFLHTNTASRYKSRLLNVVNKAKNSS